MSAHSTDHHDDHHHNPGFLSQYVFSTDHKMIGIQYGITALLFLAFGFYLMMVMRWSIAYPHQPLPEWMSWIFTDTWKARWLQDGKVTGDTYNMFGAMHGTIMVFLGIVPLGFGAFGNYVTPLQIGAPDMAFPRLNMMSYWIYIGLLIDKKRYDIMIWFLDIPVPYVTHLGSHCDKYLKEFATVKELTAKGVPLEEDEESYEEYSVRRGGNDDEEI
jgi:hypothetical protein